MKRYQCVICHIAKSFGKFENGEFLSSVPDVQRSFCLRECSVFLFKLSIWLNAVRLRRQSLKRHTMGIFSIRDNHVGLQTAKY